jgi:3-methyladenine DNA glycosylase AlkD
MKRYSAEAFLREISGYIRDDEFDKTEKFYKGSNKNTKDLGVGFSDVFTLAKKYYRMDTKDIIKLLNNDYYEIRMAAVAIMGYQAKDPEIPENRKTELFNLYLDYHDRIDNWDLVDRASYLVIGEYLLGKEESIKPLFELAESDDPWRRRSAIVSTFAYLRKKDVSVTLKIAEKLLMDEHEYVQRALGSWLREATKVDQKKTLEFLKSHTYEMNRETLKTAKEKLPKDISKMM